MSLTNFESPIKQTVFAPTFCTSYCLQMPLVKCSTPWSIWKQLFMQILGGGRGSGKQSLLSNGGFENREYINRSIPLVLWHSEISVSTACRTKVMKSVFGQHFLFLRNTCRIFLSLSCRLGGSTSLHWGLHLHSLRPNLLKMFFLII